MLLSIPKPLGERSFWKDYDEADQPLAQKDSTVQGGVTIGSGNVFSGVLINGSGNVTLNGMAAACSTKTDDDSSSCSE